MAAAYYSATMEQFWKDSASLEGSKRILDTIEDPYQRDYGKLNNLQREAWVQEIDILHTQLEELKKQLGELESKILFEYTIPRMGKRTDVVLLYRNIVFILEFKCGSTEYDNKKKAAYHQVYGYALDLSNYHEKSAGRLLVPIVVATDAKAVRNWKIEKRKHIIMPLYCNKDNIAAAMNQVVEAYPSEKPFDYTEWENSKYYPSPTIVEAARALFEGHSVREITRSEEDNGEGIAATIAEIDQIIEKSRKNKRKSICFVTGVPGAGKTLVGLKLAIQHSVSQSEERAALLSGNRPLVAVLQKALADDAEKQVKDREQDEDEDAPDTEQMEDGEEYGDEYEPDAEQEVVTGVPKFIDLVHRFRNDYFDPDIPGRRTEPPAEHIVIFDEAQRAWSLEQIKPWMEKHTKPSKKNPEKDMGFPYSEPQFLISIMDRWKDKEDWAVIVCLVGGGQEIYKGEAGLPEWFESLRREFSFENTKNRVFAEHWDVYVSPELELKGKEYLRDQSWDSLKKGLNVNPRELLHLKTSERSFRAQNLAAFVNALLNGDTEEAKAQYKLIQNPADGNDPYPIKITRDLNKARTWAKRQCVNTERCGLIASSGAKRLRPEGIFVDNVKNGNNFYQNWFLCDEDDPRSSNMLEEVMTEFGVQGLELDYSVVAWGADYRYVKSQWTYHRFGNKNWTNISKDKIAKNSQEAIKSYEDKRIYMKNAYRVLLTRARQGMVIFIPTGSEEDETRRPAFYNGTYEYLKKIGLEDLKDSDLEDI